MPALLSAEAVAGEAGVETEEDRMASLSSSPSRRSNLLFCPVARGSPSNHGSTEEDGGFHSMPGASSTETSRQVSPWASKRATPLSTPATSVMHGDLGYESTDCNRTSEKKRLSWFGSTPASQFTMLRAPRPEDSSSPSTQPFCSKRQLSRANSCSSSSSTSERHSPISKQKSARNASCIKQTAEPKAASLVPNVQFLGLMLLIILLISSPLIKVLSVVLFFAIVFLDDV